MQCPSCNNVIPDGSKFCNHCGQRIEESNSVILCSNPQCGKDIPSDSKFCPFCGSKVSSTTAGNSIQDKLTFNVNGVFFNMIRVEGGTFDMGGTPEQMETDNDEKLVHKVTLTNDYYIGETPVTQALWRAVMDYNPSSFKGDNLPVECVSWDECQDFIRKLNKKTGKTFRLPTEAEWEYAARGGKKSRHTQYSGSDNIDEVAWYDENEVAWYDKYSVSTHPVNMKQANELGIYDMSGNVWEYCQDWFDYYRIGSQTDPQGPKGPKGGFGRVVRGGSYFCDAWRCRVSYRTYCRTDDPDTGLGFRLALSE